MKGRFLLAAAAMGVMAGLAGAAHAENFDFSFSGASGGTVDGVIYGLSNGDSSPSDVVVTSSPFTSASIDLGSGGGVFVVDSGQVTGESYSNSTSEGGDLYTLALSGGGSFTVQGSQTIDNVSASTVAFTPASVSAAPEPAAWALTIAGVAMVGAALRYGRRRGWAADRAAA